MALTNEKLIQTKQHAYIGKIFGGNISSQINQQAYKIHTCGSISPAKSPQDSKFSLWKSLRPPLSGSRCYLLWQAITSLLLFITSAAWPPNHHPSAARLMQTASCSQLGVPYPLSQCNPKPRKKSTPSGSSPPKGVYTFTMMWHHKLKVIHLTWHHNSKMKHLIWHLIYLIQLYIKLSITKNIWCRFWMCYHLSTLVSLLNTSPIDTLYGVNG